MTLVLGPHWWVDLKAEAETVKADGRSELELSVEDALMIVAEHQRLRAAHVRIDYEVTENLAEAMGMTRDPDYGYPTGDHTAETLSAEMVAYCRGLRGES